MLNLIPDSGAKINLQDSCGLMSLAQAVTMQDEPQALPHLRSALRRASQARKTMYDPSVLYLAASLSMRETVELILDGSLFDPGDQKYWSAGSSTLGEYLNTALEYVCLSGMESTTRLLFSSRR